MRLPAWDSAAPWQWCRAGEGILNHTALSSLKLIEAELGEQDACGRLCLSS